MTPSETMHPRISTENPLLALARAGQSVWLDSIRRRLMTSGELARLVSEDGLAGLTSNPAIFEKAIAAGEEYLEPLAELVRSGVTAPVQVFERLAVADIRAACDVLASVHTRTAGRDGFVSLEVSPRLADDADGTVADALRLAAAVGRPNLMIKVPGTAAGLPAIRKLLAAGVSVNVTLLFARDAYRRVAETFVEAMAERSARGLPIAGIESVASFFVSRIDTLVDGLLDARAAAVAGGERERILSLRGKTAIANAKLAYEIYLEVFSDPRWAASAALGARPQRLLWASTSTKNAAYRDVLYVEELIGPETVNTMPPETVAAFRDHGHVRLALLEDVEGARTFLAELTRAGIDLDAATDRLLADGVAKFVEPYERLLATIATRVAAVAV